MKLATTTLCLLSACAPLAMHADDPARFDLAGPKVSVRVTRGSKTLPIAQVPNLQEGDKLWIKADLPPTQSNHLLLIVAFLRGTTNPPPDDWFTKIETWEKKAAEGSTITVPNGAEQALMFIAPETGGDFETLRSAVKGKPGQFIRADADLNEAAFQQLRIHKYLEAMKSVLSTDAKAVQDRSAKLASTLALKPNADCFKKPVDQQVDCLTQSSAPLILDDGHGKTVAESLSTGASSDFVNAASYTPVAGAGLYSAYVGAVVDLVHLVSSLHTAQYQYIPGLSFPNAETLNLKLNAPVSFHNPKSVIVIGLPAVQKAAPPPLRAHTANQVACLLQPKMVLLLDGAPLVYSTAFAHDLALRVDGEDMPLKPDAFEGGLVVDHADPVRKPLHDVALNGGEPMPKPAEKPATASDSIVTGTVRGYWGFDTFEGPKVTLQRVSGKNWKIVGNAQVIAGQAAHLSLQGDGTACVEHVSIGNGKDAAADVAFKPADGDMAKNTLALDVPAKATQTGDLAVMVKQFGSDAPEKVSLTAYSGDIHPESIAIHAGDRTATLKGKGVENITSVDLAGQTFLPTGSKDGAVTLEAKAEVSPKDGDEATAKLKDGRTMPVKVSVGAARPALALQSMKFTLPPDAGVAITLGAKDEIPLQGKLTFVVASEKAFDRAEKIEVATADGAVHTTLSLADSQLVLQDEHTAIGTLEPLKAFGPSAFGKLAMRPVAADGTTGAWTGLGTLVRVPQITSVKCSADACVLEGKNLFLLHSVSAEKDFAKPAEVPSGFSDSTFKAPVPSDGKTLYVKLRDDSNGTASLTLPTPIDTAAQPTPDPSAIPAATVATPAPQTTAPPQ